MSDLHNEALSQESFLVTREEAISEGQLHTGQ